MYMTQRNKKGQFKSFSLMFRTKLRLENWYEENKYLIASFVWGLLLGLLLGFGLFTPKTSPQALSKTIEVKADEVTYDEEYYTRDPITYIRYSGEKLGFSNKDITKAIRIARCESNFNQYAKNSQSTAKGIYQFIDGTWRANCLKDGNVYDFKDNINCFWKVYKVQGDRPWISSKACWNK